MISLRLYFLKNDIIRKGGFNRLRSALQGYVIRDGIATRYHPSDEYDGGDADLLRQSLADIGCTEDEKVEVYRTHNETEFMKGVLM